MESRLKHIAWIYDEENRELIIEKDKVQFAVPKRYLFSLARFLIRISQRGFYRRKK